MKTVRCCLIALCLGFGFEGFGQFAGTKLWDITLGNHVFSSPAVAPDGTLLIGVCSAAFGEPLSAYGAIYSISPRGSTNWFAETYGDLRSSPAIGPDGSIYVGSVLGYVYAFSPDGATNWVFATGKIPNLYRSFIGSSPAIGVDGTVYINVVSGYEPGSTYPDRLYSLRPDGKTNWVLALNFMSNNQVGSICVSSPAIGPDGSIYVATRDRRLYAISPTGTTNWTASLGAQAFSSPAVGPDGAIYLGAEDNKLHAFDPAGREKWTYLTSGPIESSAAVGSDAVYIGSLDRSFSSLGFDGKRRWMMTNMMFSASPALGADGSIYAVGVTSGLLYRLSASGQIEWTLDLQPGELCFSSPVIGLDGAIYVGAGRKLYAISDTNTLGTSAWPMFRGNGQHTARAIQRGMTSPSFSMNTGLTLTLSVETGRTYQVECSTNLLDWTSLAAFSSDTPNHPFQDAAATNSSQRYYRLSSQTP